MHALNDKLARLTPTLPIVIRVLVGSIFAYHGYDKFRAGIGNVEMFFASFDVPLAEIAAPAVAVLEIVGGIALIAGVATRIASLVLSVVMVGALVFVKTEVGLLGSAGEPVGAEIDLALLAGLLTVIVLGPGRASVDHAIGIDGQSPPVTV